MVGGLDLSRVLAQWGPTGFGAPGECPVEVPEWASLIEASPDPAVVFTVAQWRQIILSGYAWRVRDAATQIEMVLIPPGTFSMGCHPGTVNCSQNELPVHGVALTRAFYLGRYEVTQAQWSAVMGSNPSFFQGDSYPNSGTRPVEQVSWVSAQPFLAKTGMRMPTEAEWEYACRAGTMTAFHGYAGAPNGTNSGTTADVGAFAWFSGNNGSQGSGQYGTKPVGVLASNGFGLHDMSGNVAELINDWYSATYYASSPEINPPGPASGGGRVVRGGSWFDSAPVCRSHFRAVRAPTVVAAWLGLRVARDP